MVVSRRQRSVVCPQIFYLCDRLPGASCRRPDLPENALGGDQELRYKSGAGANEGCVTEEEQAERDDKEEGEGPEEGVSGPGGAARAPKTGPRGYLTRQTPVSL